MSVRPGLRQRIQVNLNLPRYVDTFQTEDVLSLPKAVTLLQASAQRSEQALAALNRVMERIAAVKEPA
jgi:hypothetical protein